jgi:GNAT superfamily N-acetyltransferase
MIASDWRHADAGVLRGCYDVEQRSWREDLGWDASWTWSTVEQARTTWGLPGVIAADAGGAPQGWGFYVADNLTLHIGGLVSSAPAVTDALLSFILERNDAGLPVACFIRDRAPGLERLLAARGFLVERFLYLSRPIDASAAPAEAWHRGEAGDPLAAFDLTVRDWRDDDRHEAGALLAASYSPAAARHFAPTGAPQEWARYVTGVMEQGGCGTLDRHATRVVWQGRRMRAVALVTELAAETSHLAQLAVHPDCRGRGIAAALVGDALASAAAAGRAALTLLVS